MEGKQWPPLRLIHPPLFDIMTKVPWCSTFLYLTGTADIVKPNIKLILGLVWTLILHYQISIGFESEEPVENTPRRDGNTVKQKLLEYIQVITLCMFRYGFAVLAFVSTILI